MPALLAALGGAFSWIVTALLSGLGSELFRKASLFLTFNIVIGLMLNWVSSKLPYDINSLGQLLEGQLGGLPAFALYILVEWGILQALWIVVSTMLAVFGVRLLFRAITASS